MSAFLIILVMHYSDFPGAMSTSNSEISFWYVAIAVTYKASIDAIVSVGMQT